MHSANLPSRDFSSLRDGTQRASPGLASLIVSEENMISANFKLERLMLAMAEHEGWLVPGQAQHPGGSRSYRNHNPGNLRVSPFASAIVDGFAVFKNDHMGWMAFQWDLIQKAKGMSATGLNGESTLRELIYKWAPPEDGNSTEEYLVQVLRKTSFPETMKLKELIL